MAAWIIAISHLAISHDHRQPALALGGVERTKDAYRDRRGVPMIESLVRDIQHLSNMSAMVDGAAPELAAFESELRSRLGIPATGDLKYPQHLPAGVGDPQGVAMPPGGVPRGHQQPDAAGVDEHQSAQIHHDLCVRSGGRVEEGGVELARHGGSASPANTTVTWSGSRCTVYANATPGRHPLDRAGRRTRPTLDRCCSSA